MKINAQFVDAISLPIEQPRKFPGTEEIYVVMNPYAGESSSCGNAFQQFRDSQETVIYYEPPTEDKPDKTVIAPAYPTMQPEGVRYVNSYQEYRLIVVSETLWRANCSTLEEEEELAQILMTLMDSYREISQARERLMFGAVNDPNVLSETAEMTRRIDTEFAKIPRYENHLGRGNLSESDYLLLDILNLQDDYLYDQVVGDRTDPDAYERFLQITQSLSQIATNLMDTYGIPHFVILALDGFARREYRECNLNEIYRMVEKARKITEPTVTDVENLFIPLSRYFFRGDAEPLSHLYANCAIHEAKLRELLNEKVTGYNRTYGIHEGQFVDSRFMRFDFTPEESMLVLDSSGLTSRELCGTNSIWTVVTEDSNQPAQLKLKLADILGFAAIIFQSRHWECAELMGLSIARKGYTYYSSEIWLAFENVVYRAAVLLKEMNDSGEVHNVRYKEVRSLISDLQLLRRSILI